MKPANDDLVFAVQLDTQTLFQYLQMKYQTWSSRLLIESFFAIFNRVPFVWMILDSILYTLIAYLISMLFNPEKNTTYNWLIVLVVFMYPFYDLNTAGYITTSIAYVWTMCGTLYVLYILKKFVENIAIKRYEYFLLVIGLLVAISMEQTLCILLGFILVAFVHQYLVKKLNFKKSWLLFALLTSTVAALIFVITTPGNASRVLAETAYWYPDYANFSVLTKIYLGIVPTMGIILNNAIVIVLFSILLTCAVFVKTERISYRILSILVMLFFVIFGFFKNSLLPVFPYLHQFFGIITQSQMIGEKTIYNLTPIMVIILITIAIIILLFVAFDKKWLPPIIFVAALCSRIMIGFSPTIFASSTRTAFLLYFGLIVLMFLLFKVIVPIKNKNLNTILYSILIFFAATNMLNLLYYQFSFNG